jgi:hypothetical protein
MARAGMAVVIVLAMLSITGKARGQECACCEEGGCRGLDLTTLDPDLPDLVSQRETNGLFAAGAAVGITSYVFGLLIAGSEPHRLTPVDALPVVGPLASAARNARDERGVSFLSFLGAAQAMSMLIIAAAATDLMDRRRMLLSVGAGPGGCGASLTFRLP